MSEHPIPTVGDGYDHHPTVEHAVRAIYMFAPGQEATISRSEAQGILRWWGHFNDLSPREITAILARFPSTDPGWISGSMGTDVE